MRKNLLTTTVILACLALISCGGKDSKGGKDSAKSVAQKWCDLNGKVAKAADGAEKDAADAARDKYEDEIEAKYKDNEAFMKEVEQEVEKCEDASEK